MANHDTLPASSKQYKFLKREGDYVVYESMDPAVAEAMGEQKVFESEWQSFLLNEVDGYVVLAADETDATATATTTGEETPPSSLVSTPRDSRLVYLTAGATSSLSFSALADDIQPLVDGFLFLEDANDQTGESPQIATQDMSAEAVKAYPGSAIFRGVPSIMNPNAYIGFQVFRGSKDTDYLSRLIDQANQPRWYEIDQANAQNSHRYKSPSVTEIINLGREDSNFKKKPYRFQDFAYCKYWQKIPNNYLITLRRYPFPTKDNLDAEGEGREDARGIKYDSRQLLPVATAVTWLGEASGNKISSLLGGIESGLNWKKIESTMNVVSPADPQETSNGPMPGISKWLGLIAGTTGSGKNQSTAAPPDPYTAGPWNNKVIEGLNVIDSTMARERGLKFAHKLDLVFEYEARSIGGINTKAAMLDIMSNLLLMTSATASFWGGANRFTPGSPGNTAPFLGGPAGRAAWMKGDVSGFMDSVVSQFSAAASAISDFMFAAMQDPIEAMKSLAAGGASAFMKSGSSPKGQVSGMKAILTGDPVGEWHLTVGNPFNPMMMIGNLICTGISLEFNEELGPDDFPTELKATISLEHGMPRDRDAIESMFNGGGGRLYSLPPGYESSLSSASMSPVDKYTGGGRSGDPGGSSGGGTTSTNSRFGGVKSKLVGDPNDVNKAIGSIGSQFKKTSSDIGAKWGLGYSKKPPPITKT